MEMTRKGFIAALLGLPVIGPLIGKAIPRKTAAIPLTISTADHLPLPLKAGDKLTVGFTGSGAACLYIQGDDKIYYYERDIPEQGDSRHMFIAHRDLEIRDIRIASAIPGIIQYGKTPHQVISPQLRS